MSRRLLVVAPNWLGDAVMALPAIADLHRASAFESIDMAARPSIAPLVPLVPSIRAAVVLGHTRASIAAVRAGTYDAVLLLPNSFHAAFVAYRAGVPERWGYRNELRSLLLTQGIRRPSGVHQAEYYQRLTTALGFDAGPLEPRLDVPSDLRGIGADRLGERGWDGLSPLVAIAPGAAFGGAKRWPADRFAATIDGLARDGVRAVLVGAPADLASGAEVSASVHTSLRPINLIGRTDLSTLAAVLAHCRALISNDSGAMHFAAALGLNVTAVFGPTNEQETRPLGAGRIAVVHSDVWCRPCMLRECPLTHHCMTRISVGAVLRETKAAL